MLTMGPNPNLVFDDLLGDLGRLGSHGLGGAQASLGGTQPFSQRLQGFVELKSQNLQLLQLPLPEGRRRGGGVTKIPRDEEEEEEEESFYWYFIAFKSRFFFFFCV